MAINYTVNTGVHFRKENFSKKIPYLPVKRIKRQLVKNGETVGGGGETIGGGGETVGGGGKWGCRTTGIGDNFPLGDHRFYP